MDEFCGPLFEWYDKHKRNLPWRDTRIPYYIWISEVILQQTRVAQGYDYFVRFIEHFPTVEELAAAPEDEVMRLWQGLGYYSRARNLHAAAKQVVALGEFPCTYEGIRELKGVGDYTAAAIASFAFDVPKAAVDGNVCRVWARLFGIDRDLTAIAAASERLKEFPGFRALHGNFHDGKMLLEAAGAPLLDGVLLDLGVSSPQLDDGARGFSYMADAPLDMRMNTSAYLTAEIVLNTYSEEELHRILKEYGEERWAKRIAKFIVEFRAKKPVETTGELVDIIKRAIPKGAREEGSHPAKRTFQAIRIEVNDELGVLERTIEVAVKHLRKGGRVGIISFHSLEDRIVKEKFRYLASDCICPPEMPFCQCDKVSEVKILTRKPVTATDEELEMNSRSKSAKFRAVEKII